MVVYVRNIGISGGCKAVIPMLGNEKLVCYHEFLNTIAHL